MEMNCEGLYGNELWRSLWKWIESQYSRFPLNLFLSLYYPLALYLICQFWVLPIQQQIRTWCQKYGPVEIQLSDSVENIVGKGEIARNEQFLLFPQCFQKLSVGDMSKWVCMAQRVLTLTCKLNDQSCGCPIKQHSFIHFYLYLTVLNFDNWMESRCELRNFYFVVCERTMVE